MANARQSEQVDALTRALVSAKLASLFGAAAHNH